MSTTLKALFRIMEDDPIDRVISGVTGGPEVHVEAFINDDPPTCFSAHLKTGVQMVHTLDATTLWYGLDTDLAITQEAIDWATQECKGQPYALLLAILSGFKCAAPHELEPLFCSMAFAQFCNICDPDYLGLERPNPHDLRERLLLLGARRMKEPPAGLFPVSSIFDGCDEEGPRSPEWRPLERHFIKKNPNCAYCGKPAVVVHHKKPFEWFPELELSEDNLISMCHEHHGENAHLGFHYISANPLIEQECSLHRAMVEARPANVKEYEKFALNPLFKQGE